MMGPKTLATIKTELKDALARTGKDPIDWLQDRIELLAKAGKSNHGEIELLQDLCGLLQEPKKGKPKAKAVRARARR
jgi:hypothetical protein